MSIEEIAARHGFSADAGRAAYAALQAGGFSQAQFSHPELGGMGQWMSGGMMMIGDMFNDNLKWRVGGLLSELSQHREPQPAMAPQQGSWGFAQSGNWWPAELGSPASSGSQNDMAYAWFPASRRLLLRLSGDVFAFDTGDLSIYGVQQQQGNWGFAQSGNWWPAELGSPASSGSQNDMAYAWFPASRRLLLRLSGDVFAFDTGDLSIYGVQQQQGSGMSSIVLNTSNGPMNLLGLNHA